MILILSVALAALAVAFFFEHHDRSAGARQQSRHHFGPALGKPVDGRIPGEFEHHDALLLGINELIQHHPKTLVDIVSALDGHTQILGLISAPEQKQQTFDLLRKNGIATDHVHFFLWPAASMWVQDFGPVSLVNGDVRIIDFDYNFKERDVENQLPLAFAATYDMEIAHCRLSLEGGNILSNGRGLCVSSATLIEQNKSRGYDLQAIGSILKNDFRFSQWTYLVPLIGEPTGHVDMFLTVAAPDTVVIGQFDPDNDKENAAQLDHNAATLASVEVDGRPLRVVRIPMPPRRDDKWRTYTNVIYSNGVLLVPQYPNYSPELDRKALEIYRQVLPDWKIVGIDSSTVIENRGSLHCLSLALPMMPDLKASE